MVDDGYGHVRDERETDQPAKCWKSRITRHDDLTMVLGAFLTTLFLHILSESENMEIKKVHTSMPTKQLGSSFSCH
jgi:hypothetical protein